MLTIKTSIDQLKGDVKPNGNKRYKVLLNAGGGVFGNIITNLMSSLDQDIYQKIDVVGGTSIGGILSLLYSVNSDYKWINQLFKNGVEKIFKKRVFGGFTGPMYDNVQLKNFISKVLHEYKLSDINRINQRQLHVIIPTLDFNLTQPRVFDNINVDPLNDTFLWKIGLATAAAPTYFPAVKYAWKCDSITKQQLLQRPVNQQIYFLTKQMVEYQQKRRLTACDVVINKKQSALIDGGVLQNIPVITTYTTLRSQLGICPEDIDMFIIGTGQDFRPCDTTTQDINSWSYLDWLTKFLIPYVTQANQTTSVYWGSLFGFNSFCYFNPLKVSGSLDDCSIVPTLQKQCKQIQQQFKKQLYQFIQK